MHNQNDFVQCIINWFIITAKYKIDSLIRFFYNLDNKQIFKANVCLSLEVDFQRTME